MRVLLPINLDRWRFSIATALRETCIRIPEIAFYSFSNPITEEDRVLGESIWKRPNLHRLGPLRTFHHQFDIVHQASATNRNLAASLLARARSLGRCRHLYTAQVEFYREDPWYWHHEVCVRIAHRITAVSRAVADSVRKTFGRSVDAVIPNGVDLDFFSREAASSVDLDRLQIRKPYVIFVATLEQRKRPDVFIELSKLMPEIDFVMLGGYIHLKERDGYLAAMRDCKNVRFLALQHRSVLRDLYAGALALIFPSEIEGLPLTVVEAQAMGLPVLAQPKSCMPEVIEDGHTGFLMPVERPELWVTKVREILAWSASKRRTYGYAARQSVRQRYSWDVIAPQYREMYLAMRG
jgi:glycosyltransferase involved in cell wall biosynthesis